MIIGEATKYGTGIEILGDYYDLKNLRSVLLEVVNGINEDSPDAKLILNLAYEVRKAYELSRETVKLGTDDYDKVIYRSFKYHWTLYLVTVNLLRQRIGYLPTNLNQQSVICTLENIGIEALKKFDYSVGEKLSLWLTDYKIYFSPLLAIMAEKITFDYLQESDGKKRFKSIIEKMRIFMILSKENSDFMREIEERAKELGINPNELEISDEDFNSLKYKW
jgi:hypothetical protein